MNRLHRYPFRTSAAVGLLALGTAFAQVDRSRFLVIENGWLKLLTGFVVVVAAIVLAAYLYGDTRLARADGRASKLAA